MIRKRLTQMSTDASSPLRRGKMAADENIRSARTDEGTLMLLRLMHEMNLNVIFPALFPHCFLLAEVGLHCFNSVISLVNFLFFSGLMAPDHRADDPNLA